MTSKQIISFLLIFLGLYSFNSITGQLDTIANGYNPKNATSEVNKKRRNLMLSLGGATYTVGSFALYKTWYEDYPRSSFHFYNDSREWRGMDKAGHLYSTYSQSKLCYQGWRWAGQSEQTAIWSGFACGLIFQSTIEVMDGFSEEWGFSWTDMGANLLGGGLFVGQQKAWGEQRILIKNSSSPKSYDFFENGSEQQNLLDNRIQRLYGSGYLQNWLKDYNGQTVWLSANMRSFFPKLPVPEWLNLSLGYGAENMIGGYSNQWRDNDKEIVIDSELYPRYSQFYISLDADLSKVHTRSPFVRTLLDVLNVLKMPFSAIEINTRGEVKFHLLHF